MSTANKRLGVCLEANQDTLDTVPYLTHQDFVKQIKEMTDLVDYAVVNLTSHDALPAGLQQYYDNPRSVEKLFEAVSKARKLELGKLAALEYEKMTGDSEDYLASVGRLYTRNSIISNLRPMKLFVKVNLDQ